MKEPSQLVSVIPRLHVCPSAVNCDRDSHVNNRGSFSTVCGKKVARLKRVYGTDMETKECRQFYPTPPMTPANTHTHTHIRTSTPWLCADWYRPCFTVHIQGQGLNEDWCWWDVAPNWQQWVCDIVCVCVSLFKIHRKTVEISLFVDAHVFGTQDWEHKVE